MITKCETLISMTVQEHNEMAATNQLKGLAILAVVVLHILSNIPGKYITTPQILPWVLAIDQIARFCVPIFVAISGYGLFRK